MRAALPRIQPVAGDLWIMRFPLNLIGTSIGRTVTLIRLRSGGLIIHSTAPFQAADVAAISALGEPAALVEATRFHDTFARAGRAAFPAIPYLAPEGFSGIAGVETASLADPPTSWAGELAVLRLDGMPNVQEHVFLHHSSRTLIVADLVFNFGPDATPWTRFFFRRAAGIRNYPGMSRMFRMMIRDRDAFAQSLDRMMRSDFDRVIVAHREIIEPDGKAKLADALAVHGFRTF